MNCAHAQTIEVIHSTRGESSSSNVPPLVQLPNDIWEFFSTDEDEPTEVLGSSRGDNNGGNGGNGGGDTEELHISE